MKKIVCLMMAALMFVFPFISVNAEEAPKEKVKVHIFYSETCSFCKALHEFTDELAEDKEYKDMFEVVDYSLSDSANSVLMDEVGSYFGDDTGSVPYYVIGDETFIGFSVESSADKIKDAIEEAYNDEEYTDIVSSIADGSLDIDDSKLTEEDDDKDDNDTVGYVILAITAVIVIVIICSRSGESYYDENSIEEDVEEEEVVEEEVEEEEVEEEEEPEKTASTSKSTTSKKTSTSTKKKKTNSKKKK